jgi:hypothetical protein
MPTTSSLTACAVVPSPHCGYSLELIRLMIHQSISHRQVDQTISKKNKLGIQPKTATVAMSASEQVSR